MALTPRSRLAWLVWSMLSLAFGAGLCAMFLQDAAQPPDGAIVTAHTLVCWDAGRSKYSHGGCNATYTDPRGNDRAVFIGDLGAGDEDRDVRVRITNHGGNTDDATTDLHPSPLPEKIFAVALLPVVAIAGTLVSYAILRALTPARAPLPPRRWMPYPGRPSRRWPGRTGATYRPAAGNGGAGPRRR